MLPLPKDVKQALLKLARRAIANAVFDNGHPEISPSAGPLAQSAGVFVSLHRAGRLRGCIGNIGPVGPLAASMVNCAVRAALHDPRFPPVVPEEVAQLEIEISVLSPAKSIRPAEISVGRHGLMIKQGKLRAVLLPQVAVARCWTRERFLEETCRKAGLPEDAWKDSNTQLFAFETQVFREADFEEPPEEKGRFAPRKTQV